MPSFSDDKVEELVRNAKQDGRKRLKITIAENPSMPTIAELCRGLSRDFEELAGLFDSLDTDNPEECANIVELLSEMNNAYTQVVDTANELDESEGEEEGGEDEDEDEGEEELEPEGEEDEPPDVDALIEDELREHPWLTKDQAAQIVADHLGCK